MLRHAALAFAVLLGTLAPAYAQQQPRAGQQGGQQGGAVRSEQWYGQQLTELSEVLGGAHYLRILCQGRGDQRWRDYMRGVIEREPSYRDRLVEGFNRGYRDQETRFAVCDRPASQMEAELRARGLRVAGGLSARHGE